MLPFLLTCVVSLLVANVHSQQSHPLFRAQSQGVVLQKQQSGQQQQPPQQQFVPVAQQQGQQQQFVVVSSQQQQPSGQPQFIYVPQQESPQQQFVVRPQQQTVRQVQSQQQFVAQPQQFAAQAQPQPQPQAQPAQPLGPQINWGKCPQLEPTDREKMAKATVITKCLENTPLPANITRETVELHREQIAACALQSEGWFSSRGLYDYNKAESEIRNKKLSKSTEDQVLSYHQQCKTEAEEKFPVTKSSVIAQIQLYQACMDYFISDVCGIEVNEPEAPQFAGAQQ